MLQSKDPIQETEALKLEHDWIWRAIGIISWVIAIVMVSAIFATWAQIIFPMVPPEKRNTFAFLMLQAYAIIEIGYLIIGAWFGVLGRLIGYAWQVRKRIAKLGSEKRN